MRTKILLGAMICGLLSLGYAFMVHTPVAEAGPAKNLQVLPKGMEKKEVKKIMKKMAKALGVECDHCHNLDDMAEDTKHKKVGREMMIMTKVINDKYMKDRDEKVTCFTCHRGKKVPLGK